MDDESEDGTSAFDRYSASCESSSSAGSYALVAGAVHRFLKNKRRKLMRRRKSTIQKLLPFSYTITFEDITRALDPFHFQRSYRMSKPCFEQLLGDVQDLVEKPYKASTEYRRSTVPPEIRLAITLRLLAGASYLDLMLAYQVAEETIRDIFRDTCDSLMTRLRLKGFPKSQAGLRAIERGFQTSRKDVSPLSGCVGALDGICLKIKKPEAVENPAMFFSRKGFYAIPVQALVDSNYIFRFCSAVCTGATHDSLAFSVSGLRRELEKGILGAVFYIVGDEAYICTDYLITPVPMSVADTDEDNFNYFLSSLRMHVEQAFGMLVARWRILKGGLNFSVSRSTDIVCLCMKLHNYVIENDRERSVLRHQLTDHEKDQIEVDINEWIIESKDTAR